MKKRKKAILLVCFILVTVIFTAYGITRWVRVQLPEQFSINRVYITLHPDSIFLKIRTVVPGNGLANRLLDSMRYSVSFDTVEFASATKYFGNEVADTFIDLPLGMDKEVLFSTIKKLQVKDSTYLNIKLEPFVNMPGKGNKKIPFTINKRMRVPIPPQVTIEDIDLEKLRLHEIELNAALQVINPNPFEFIIHGGALQVDFIELFDAALVISEPVHLKNADTTSIKSNLELGEIKVARTVWNYAFKKEELQYRIYGKIYISTVDEPNDTIDVILKSEKNTFSKKKAI